MEQHIGYHSVSFSWFFLGTRDNSTSQNDLIPTLELQKVQKTIVQTKIWFNDRESQL